MYQKIFYHRFSSSNSFRSCSIKCFPLVILIFLNFCWDIWIQKVDSLVFAWVTRVCTRNALFMQILQTWNRCHWEVVTIKFSFNKCPLQKVEMASSLISNKNQNDSIVCITGEFYIFSMEVCITRSLDSPVYVSSVSRYSNSHFSGKIRINPNCTRVPLIGPEEVGSLLKKTEFKNLVRPSL